MKATPGLLEKGRGSLLIIRLMRPVLTASRPPPTFADDYDRDIAFALGNGMTLAQGTLMPRR